MRVAEEDEAADIEAAYRLLRRAERFARGATAPRDVHAQIRIVRSVMANFPNAVIQGAGAAAYIRRLWARYDEVVMEELRREQDEYDRLKRQRRLDDERADCLDRQQRLAKRMRDKSAREAELSRIAEEQAVLERELRERGRTDERTL